MTRQRFELSDEQWAKLEPLLPSRKSQCGRPAGDDRRIINGILWILRTGAPWRDLPERYGAVGTVSSRFYRWRKAGVWERIFSQVQQQADQAGRIDWEVHYVDGTIVRAHPHTAGAKGGVRRAKPSACQERNEVSAKQRIKMSPNQQPKSPFAII
jgi:transposase